MKQIEIPVDENDFVGFVSDFGPKNIFGGLRMGLGWTSNQICCFGTGFKPLRTLLPVS